jgi:hypothetical protein
MMTPPSVQVVARYIHFGTSMPLRVGASIPLLLVPDAEDEALLGQYIDGTATLAALYAHACEYAVAAQEREQQQQTKEELTVPPLGKR